MSIHKEQVCQVTLTALNESGEGIGLWENTPVHVEGGVLGDIVKARITAVKKTYAMAKMVKIIKESPMRIEPECPYYKRCTGCQLQSTEYEVGQLAYKQESVRQALDKSGIVLESPIPSIIGISPEGRIRTGALYHVSPAKTGIRIGFMEKDGKTVMDTLACPLQQMTHAPLLEAVKTAMSGGLVTLYQEKTKNGSLQSLIIKQKDPDCLESGLQMILNVSPERRPKEHQLIQHLSAASVIPVEVVFNEQPSLVIGLAAVPVSREIMNHQEALLNKWIQDVGNGHLTLLEDDKGWIAAFLSKNKMPVTRLEKGETADAGDLETESVNWIVSTGKKGCTSPRMALIDSHRPKRMAFIGLKPAALAKDLKQLTETMGYRIVGIQPLDSAPYLTQVTCLVCLER